MQFNFLPLWYKEKKSKKKIKKIIILIVISIFIGSYNLLNLISGLNTLSKGKTLNTSISSFNDNNKKSTEKKDLSSLDCLDKFKNIFSNSDDWNSVKIQDNLVEATISVNNIENFNDDVKEIEKNDNIKIQKLSSPINTGEGKLKFQIIMGVKN